MSSSPYSSQRFSEIHATIPHIAVVTRVVSLRWRESLLMSIHHVSMVRVMTCFHISPVMVGVAHILTAPHMMSMEGVDPGNRMWLGFARMSLGDVLRPPTTTMRSLSRTMLLLLWSGSRFYFGACRLHSSRVIAELTMFIH
jgi:hypothetical protein